MIEQIDIGEKKIKLVGTAHVSQKSVDLVREVIENEKPDTVCVELCESRYQSVIQEDRWQNMDIVKVIKEKKVFLLLSNLILASFQKKIAAKLDIKPGAEMLEAIAVAKEVGAKIELADRDVRTTLARAWRAMSLWSKIRLFFQLILSMGDADDISEKDIEELKKSDMLESLIKDIGSEMPVLKEILIDERDKYIAEKIKRASGKNIVAVVGAGHVPGIKKRIHENHNIKSLDEIPSKKAIFQILKWALPAGILALFVVGFFQGGFATGKDMIIWWVLANGIMAGIGAAAAMAHPYTILSSVLAAPLTSLNPMIAAGWISGLAEAFFRKPKVKDCRRLSEDIVSIKGFWKNKVTRILLVVVFTNIGSSIGTMIALPILLKVL